MKSRLWTCALIPALWACAVAVAAPVPSGLSVTGSVSIDTVNSGDASGGATQTGTLTHISGGVTTSSSFTGNPAGAAPSLLSGALSATGDGIGAAFSMAGSVIGAQNFAGLFADYALNLSNSSASETYVITFRGLFTNSVSASGNDAFAYSDISVLDDLASEVLFSFHWADTLNAANNQVDDSTGDTFTVTLNPGASTSFSALQRQRGGVYDSGAFAASLDAFLMIDNVLVRGGNPTPVPLPGTLALSLLALGALACKRCA